MDMTTKRRMIMTKTPLRMTFVGGGTDIPSFYRANGPGAVVSAAINKYVYITVNKKFDDNIRVSYSKTEIVEHVDKVQHPIVREALKLLGIRGGVEIVSISDIPSGGTGLGSSSSFAVGLLNALHSWNGELVSARQLAEEAVDIEVNILKEPIGKQDQYIAAYGGMQFIEFHKDESVTVNPVIMLEEHRRALQDSLLLLYTGRQRSASEILADQVREVGSHVDTYRRMGELASSMYRSLSGGEWGRTGSLLQENWELKKTLTGKISDAWLDGMYAAALDAGATGGKLIGAGGGGFLLFFAPITNHSEIKKALGMREEPFSFEPLGSRIIYVGD